MNQEKRDYYHLREICILFNILGDSFDIDDIDINNVSFKNKGYSIKKQRNHLLVKCSDGRCLKLDMYSYSYKDGIYHNLFDEAKVMYSFDNESVFELCNSWRYGDYDVFKELTASELGDHLKMMYYRKVGDHSVSFEVFNQDFSEVKSFDSLVNGRFCFLNDKIVYNDFMDISLDGSKILAIDGKEVLSEADVKKFSIQSEKKRVKELLDSDDTLHSCVKKILMESIHGLEDDREYANYVLELNRNIVPMCKDVIQARCEFLKHQNGDYMFDQEELLFVSDVLSDFIKRYYSREEEDNSFPLEKAYKRKF